MVLQNQIKYPLQQPAISISQLFVGIGIVRKKLEHLQVLHNPVQTNVLKCYNCYKIHVGKDDRQIRCSHPVEKNSYGVYVILKAVNANNNIINVNVTRNQTEYGFNYQKLKCCWGIVLTKRMKSIWCYKYLYSARSFCKRYLSQSFKRANLVMYFNTVSQSMNGFCLPTTCHK